MIPQKWLIDGFQGTMIEYILYLENKVLNRIPPILPLSDAHNPNRNKLQISHYKHIDGEPAQSRPAQSRKRKRSQPSEPSTPPETPDTSETPETPEPSQTSEPPEPSEVQPVQPAPRWQSSMDMMIESMAAENVLSRRKAIGLSSQAEIIEALNILIHGNQGKDISNHNTTPSDDSFSSLNPTLQLLNTFAVTTDCLRIQTSFIEQIYHFRMLIFVSICCVAIYDGADEELIHTVMKKCVSNSGKKNLRRIRKGALWVNRMMEKLSRDGFGHFAFEIFVLCEYEGLL